MNIEFTDRYKALGIPYPDLKTMCKGPCEGIGLYPQFIPFKKFKKNVAYLVEDVTLEEERLWWESHRKGNYFKRLWHSFKCDGWHFIKCPYCGGSGKSQ